MRTFIPLLLAGALAAAGAAAPRRVNQEGRILGPPPVVTTPVLFNTPEADKVLAAMQIFPVSNPWNENISRRPVLANSDAMIARIIADLAPNRRSLIAFQEMNFVLVPDNQPRRPIAFVDYPDESDLDGGVSPNGLYPIPPNLPIEGWPAQTGAQTLAQWQTNANGGDRHSIIVAPGSGTIWETWTTQLRNGKWKAANGAIFHLTANAQRPAGRTSGDAAGFPMFPALVRYDEAERGMVEHACRLVVKRSRYNTYIYPATHFAAPAANTDPNLPAMGQRLRLKAGFVIPATWTKEEKAVLLALKKYGAMVADNGNFFSISVTPDNRWPANCFSHFSAVGLTNFEVIWTTKPAEGPRSPGAPTASAGREQTGAVGAPVRLQGWVDSTGAPPAIRWTLYSGPGAVTFADPTRPDTTATFNAPGVFTLMLSADDAIHAVSYDAVEVTIH
jgi:hypothetical protein